MALVELVVIGAYGSALLGTVGLTAWLDPDARRGRENRRRLAKTPVTPSAELTAGTDARVRGRIVAADETFTAPLTGRASVFYDARAVVCTSDDDFVEHSVDAARAGFWVLDGTGAVFVRAVGLRTVVVREDYDRRLQARIDVDPGMHAAVQRFEKEFRAKLQGGRLIAGRIHSLDVGEEVTVWGSVVEEPMVGLPGQAGYRDVPTRVPVLTEPVVSDDPEFLR